MLLLLLLLLPPPPSLLLLPLLLLLLPPPSSSLSPPSFSSSPPPPCAKGLAPVHHEMDCEGVCRGVLFLVVGECRGFPLVVVHSALPRHVQPQYGLRIVSQPVARQNLQFMRVCARACVCL